MLLFIQPSESYSVWVSWPLVICKFCNCILKLTPIPHSLWSFWSERLQPIGCVYDFAFGFAFRWRFFCSSSQPIIVTVLAGKREVCQKENSLEKVPDICMARPSLISADEYAIYFIWGWTHLESGSCTIGPMNDRCSSQDKPGVLSLPGQARVKPLWFSNLALEI
jgi:hypothetical protein